MKRCPLKNKASKKGITVSVISSLAVHLFILNIAVFCHIINKEEPITPEISVSIVSVAAPSSVASQKASKEPEHKKEIKEAKTVKEPEPKQEPEREMAKKSEFPPLEKPKSIVEQKPSELAEISPAAAKPAETPIDNNQKQQLTSNDKGNSVSTIHTVSEADYAHTTPPEYPRRAIDRGQQGIVVVKALISKDGNPAKVTVYTSSGYDLLDRSALDAVKEWSFKPSALADNQISSWILVPVKFVIQG